MVRIFSKILLLSFIATFSVEASFAQSSTKSNRTKKLGNSKSNSAISSPEISSSAGLDTYIQTLIAEATRISSSTKLDTKQKVSMSRELLKKYLDTAWMGKYVLGSFKNTLNPPEIKEFLDIYSKYVLNTYAKAVKNYKGQTVKVKSVAPNGENEYIVATQIVSNDNTINVEFMVRKYDSNHTSKFKVFDIITEGVSLIMTQRSEFSSILGSEGIEKLKGELKQKS